MQGVYMPYMGGTTFEFVLYIVRRKKKNYIYIYIPYIIIKMYLKQFYVNSAPHLNAGMQLNADRMLPE